MTKANRMTQCEQLMRTLSERGRSHPGSSRCEDEPVRSGRKKRSKQYQPSIGDRVIITRVDDDFVGRIGLVFRKRGATMWWIRLETDQDSGLPSQEVYRKINGFKFLSW